MALLRAGSGRLLPAAGALGTARPALVGWKSTEDAVAFDATTIPLAPSARRLEYSTPSYAAGAALTAAVDYLLDLGIANVLEHDLALAGELRAGLERLGAEVLTPAADDHRAGIVCVRFPGRTAPRWRPRSPRRA